MRLTTWWCNACADRRACETTTDSEEAPTGCPFGQTPFWENGEKAMIEEIRGIEREKDTDTEASE